MSDVFDRIMSIAMPLARKAAEGDEQAGADLIEALSTALARSVARIADGDKTLVDTLLIGCEAHILCEAVSTTESMQWLKKIRSDKQ